MRIASTIGCELAEEMSSFLDEEAFEARSNSQEDSEGSDEIPITTSRSKKPKRALAALFTDSGGSVSESEAERVNLSKRAKVLNYIIAIQVYAASTLI